MAEGWIKLHRSLLDWEWYDNPNTLVLFIHLLIRANYKPSRWRGIDLTIGQLFTGRKKLSEKTGLSEQSVRTSLDQLKDSRTITIKATSRGSIVTICNYSKYQECFQGVNQQGHQRSTSSQPETNHIQEGKKNKKKEKTFAETSEPFRLARLLFSCIRKNKHDFKQPNLQKWALHVEYMLRLDKRDPEEIDQVIRWAQADNISNTNDFCWAANILSTQKLRKQYDQLVIKMKNDQVVCTMSDLPPEI